MVSAYFSQFKKLSFNVKLFLFGNALQGMGMSIYGLLFNLYLKELGYGESSIGGLISTTSLGITLMAIPAAFIIERFHVKHLVISGMLVSSLFYFFQILTVDEKSLFTLGLCASMFLALFNISIAPFYLRNSTPEIRVHLFSLNSALNMMAHLVGYFVGGFLPKTIQWYLPQANMVDVYRTSIMAALSIVFLSNLIFIRIQKVPIPQVKKRVFEGLKERDWSLLSKLTLPKLCIAFGGGLVVPFMNLYLKEKFKFSPGMIGVSFAILQFFIFTGIFLAPTFVKKTTPLRFILTTSLLSIPFMITMGISGNVALVLGCFFIRGMLMNMGSPITSMFEMERVSEKECVFASAIILCFYHLTYSLGIRLGGFLIELYSFGPTFYIAGVAYILGIVLYHRFFKQEEVGAMEVKTEEAAEIMSKVKAA